MAQGAELIIMWFALALILFVIEIIKPKWVIFWFGLGALGGAITAVVAPGRTPAESFYLQVLVFFAISISLLILARPVIIRLVLPKKKATNIEAAIGREELCIEDIDNDIKKGAVRLYGTPWKARSSDDDVKIRAGQKVKIIGVNGLELIVEPVKKEEGR